MTKKLIGGLAALLFAFGCATTKNESAEPQGTGGSGSDTESVQQSGDYRENSEEARGENVPPSGTSQDATVQAGDETWDTETSEPTMGTNESDQTSPGATARAGESSESGAEADSQVIDEGTSDTAVGGSGEEGMSDENLESTDEGLSDDSAMGGSGDIEQQCKDLGYEKKSDE